ncbi:MAG: proline dehydrogenase [Bacteroidetes bacterium]|nr:MAG: proline dehydrogenase [Bacteroidota bacterium]
MKIDFQNTEVAFAMKSDADLKKAYVLFKTIGSPTVVKMGNTMLNLALKINFPINWIVKPTIYNHFVGGESIDDCKPVVRKMEPFNVGAILDYSVEGKDSPEDIQNALDETLRAIENAGKDPNIPFCVFKPTAFTTATVLEKVSMGWDLTPEEEAEAQRFRDRIHKLCETAHAHDVPILIDAEDSWYQNFIDDVSNANMAEFNKEKAIVFNTFQMYRHDRLDFLKKSYQMAIDGGYYLGAKFVRGAYMEKERARAAAKGYEDPIQPNKEATDRDYNLALKFCVEHIGKIKVFNGTHNEYSTQYLIDLMEEHGLAKDDDRLWFSQLYGMSDNLSFNVGKAGYNVAKYVPYGPVKHVMPYLLRRAEENTSAQGQSGRELNLVVQEMKRRRLKK